MGKKATVIAYEGLLGSAGQWLWHGLIKKIDQVKYAVTWRGWLAWGRPKCNVVIGHSFGAWPASQTDADVCVLIDPVMPPFGLGKFKAREGVRTICIYQRKRIPIGHAVEGAENVELTDTTHTAITAHPLVNFKIKEVLNGQPQDR